MQPSKENTQQGVMAQPPQMVSTKDCLMIRDMLHWNLLASKKANSFAQHVQDQEIAQEIQRCGQMHQRHYDQILNRLQQAGRTPVATNQA